MNGHDYPELFEPTDEERRRDEDDEAAEAVWLYTPAMHLQAYFDWGRAYRRGLVSDREMSNYGLLVEASPLSWKGWVKALIDFGNEEIAS